MRRCSRHGTEDTERKTRKCTHSTSLARNKQIERRRRRTSVSESSPSVSLSTHTVYRTTGQNQAAMTSSQPRVVGPIQRHKLLALTGTDEPACIGSRRRHSPSVCSAVCRGACAVCQSAVATVQSISALIYAVQSANYSEVSRNICTVCRSG